MKALIQRVSTANVKVDGKIIGEIGSGLLVFLGITHDDTQKDIDTLINKMINLRIFPSQKGSFDRSLLEEGKEVLVVSQFTLYGSTKNGRRPDFIQAAKPDLAEKLYDQFVLKLKAQGVKTATGLFQAMMEVSLVNDGPVTFMLESK